MLRAVKWALFISLVWPKPCLQAQEPQAEHERFSDDLIITSSVACNAAAFGILKTMERVSPDVTAHLLRCAARVDACYVEPFLPAITPFLNSSSPKVRWSTVLLLVASRNDLVIDPILSVLKAFGKNDLYG